MSRRRNIPVPEPPDEPSTQPGDLIYLGRHRLLCGDSANPDDVRKLLDGQHVQLINMDPPYNVNVEPRSNNAIAAAGKARKHHQGLDLARFPEKSKPTGKMRARDRVLENDFVSPEEFEQMLRAWFQNAADALRTRPRRIVTRKAQTLAHAIDSRKCESPLEETRFYGCLTDPGEGAWSSASSM